MKEKSTIVVAEASRARTAEPGLPLPATPQSEIGQIMSMIAAASRDRDFDPDKMLKLYDLRDREINRVARMDFVEAMAKFKENPPKIVKDKRVFYPSKSGGASTEFWHATLGNIVAQVIDGLAAVGISHNWKVRYEGALIYVACVLTHRGGHAETTDWPPLTADTSGSKNAIQAQASSVTYAQRYTLLAACGLAAADDDDGAGGEKDYERITESQAADLAALIEEHGKNKVKLLAYLNLETLSDIRAENYASTCALVREPAKRSSAK